MSWTSTPSRPCSKAGPASCWTTGSTPSCTLGFYVTVVDDLVRDEERDDPTLGILIAKSRDKGTIEYALRSNNAPLAVSTYAALPPHVRELMPSAEDLSRIADDILDGDGEGVGQPGDSPVINCAAACCTIGPP
ncbi:PDDEXK nuclease domain-containing protein [Streptomyces antimycoticus]|uniref:PDDEXK nuclease domain-containing protein n=1 Tax=Streptomyces antimycoticus TaxID=68175 RepID=UPI00369494F9